jgi:hypothetical protein
MRRSLVGRASRALATTLVLLSWVSAKSLGQATTAPPPRTAIDTAFGATFARLSEPAGYFDTDNLISNEASYLHVITRLRKLGVQGGAYIGVGPDQNYSYIAAIRPRIAFIMDVRRDNALQHLMYKALFARSRNRIDYLCRLLGKAAPPNVSDWETRSIDDIVGWVDKAPANATLAAAEQRAVVDEASRYGIPLTPADRATISRFHGEFIREGLSLRFSTFGRTPRSYYPTLRQLILEHDLLGREASFLANEDDFRFVKSLHAANRIIPLVGNLGGDRAFAALARELESRNERLSALYTSNVEFYLWGDASFNNFARNVSRMPRTPNAVIIRSYFGRQFGDAHPLAVSGYVSVQLLQPIDDFARRFTAGEWGSYRDLVTLGAR